MKEPYRDNLIQTNIFVAKRDVTAAVVMVFHHMIDDRGLSLLPFPTRAVCKNQIHEVIFTDEANAGPGVRVDRISGLGFVEITQGGIVCTSDQVFLDGVCVGRVAGFDATHAPNHLNIVVRCAQRRPAPEMGVSLNSRLTFRLNG